MATNDRHAAAPLTAQIIIPIVTTVIILFGAILAFGDRFISQKEHADFVAAINAEVRRNEGIIAGKMDRTDFAIWEKKRDQFLDEALRELHNKLSREEFDRWLTERKHHEDLAALSPLATKAYVDAQDQKAIAGIEVLNRRIDQVYALYRSLAEHHLRSSPNEDLK